MLQVTGNFKKNYFLKFIFKHNFILCCRFIKNKRKKISFVDRLCFRNKKEGDKNFLFFFFNFLFNCRLLKGKVSGCFCMYSMCVLKSETVCSVCEK